MDVLTKSLTRQSQKTIPTVSTQIQATSFLIARSCHWFSKIFLVPLHPLEFDYLCHHCIRQLSDGAFR